jgi:hypothetical protein
LVHRIARSFLTAYFGDILLENSRLEPQLARVHEVARTSWPASSGVGLTEHHASAVDAAAASSAHDNYRKRRRDDVNPPDQSQFSCEKIRSTAVSRR